MFTEPSTLVSRSLVARLSRLVGNMGGSVRMSGIPYHPQDQVPTKHGGTDPVRIEENQPLTVTYDKNGLVHPQDLPKPISNGFVAPNNTLAITESYKGTPVGRPVVSSAKRVSTQTAAEVRAIAKARKASTPSPRRDYSN